MISTRTLAWTNGTARMHSSAMATACSATTSSTIAVTNRWGARGTISTSRRLGARRNGRTRRKIIVKHHRMNGGTGTTSVLVVPVPPFIRWCLTIIFRRVLPFLLAPKRRDVEIVPRAPHLFVTAIVDEVVAEHAVAIADECIRAVPFVHAKVLVEIIGDRIPRNELPAHARLQAFDVFLRRTRRKYKSGIPRV